MTIGSHVNGSRVDRASRLRDEDRADPLAGLHDPELERDVIFALVTFPDLIRPSEIKTRDFHAHANALVFSELNRLEADGSLEHSGDEIARSVVNMAHVRGALHDTGKLPQAGGDDHLAYLQSGIPHRLVDFKRLRRLTLKRNAFNYGRLIVARATDEAELARALAGLSRTQNELEALSRDGTSHSRDGELLPLSQLIEPALVRAERRRTGDEAPIPVPFPSYADALGGGLYAGLHLITGPTGTGKSQIAMQMALHAAQHGWPVVYIGLELDETQIALRAIAGGAGLRWSSLYRGACAPTEIDSARVAASAVATLPIYCEFAPGRGWSMFLLALAVTTPLDGAHANFTRTGFPFRWNLQELATPTSLDIGGIRLVYAEETCGGPRSLRYAEGQLAIELDACQQRAARTLRVPFDPSELSALLQTARETSVGGDRKPRKQVEASIDVPLVPINDRDPYRIKYSDAPLLEQFLIGVDGDFAALVQQGINYPVGPERPPHPYLVQRTLLRDGSSSAYSALFGKFIRPPVSWPRLIMRYAPGSEALVNLDFAPNPLFLTDHGEVIAADDDDVQLAQQPYQHLIDDVREHPEIYLQAVGSLNRAREVTLALAALRAMCSTPGTCRELEQLSAARFERFDAPTRLAPPPSVAQAKITVGRSWRVAFESLQGAPSADADSAIDRGYELVNAALERLRLGQKWARLEEDARSDVERERQRAANPLRRETLDRQYRLVTRWNKMTLTAEHIAEVIEPTTNRRRAHQLLARASDFFALASLPSDAALAFARAAVLAEQENLDGAAAQFREGLSHETTSTPAWLRAADTKLAIDIIDSFPELAQHLDAQGGWIDRLSKPGIAKVVRARLQIRRKECFRSVNELVERAFAKSEPVAELTRLEFRAIRGLLTSRAGGDSEDAISRDDLLLLFGRLSYLIGTAALPDVQAARQRQRFLHHYTVGLEPSWLRSWFADDTRYRALAELDMKLASAAHP